jgi:hypothetical protein
MQFKQLGKDFTAAVYELNGLTLAPGMCVSNVEKSQQLDVQ